jgi:hypothetical protein
LGLPVNLPLQSRSAAGLSLLRAAMVAVEMLDDAGDERDC